MWTHVLNISLFSTSLCFVTSLCFGCLSDAGSSCWDEAWTGDAWWIRQQLVVIGGSWTGSPMSSAQHRLPASSSRHGSTAARHHSARLWTARTGALSLLAFSHRAFPVAAWVPWEGCRKRRQNLGSFGFFFIEFVVFSYCLFLCPSFLYSRLSRIMHFPSAIHVFKLSLVEKKLFNCDIFSEAQYCPFLCQRGSVVRTSDLGWRTFPDLWLKCDHFVGKVSAMGQPIRPTQPSIPSGSLNE